MERNDGWVRNRSGFRTTLALVVVASGLAATAHAQPNKIGTVLGIPADALSSFRIANQMTGTDGYGHPVPPNEVTLLHVSPGSGLTGPTIATVSITQQGSGLKAWRVYFPLQSDGTLSPLYQQINGRDVFTNPRFLRVGAGGVVQMDVRQDYPGDMDLEQTRFLLLPMNTLYLLEAANPKATLTPVHLQRMPYNAWGTWVLLVAVDAENARQLKIPEEMISQLRVLNSNVIVGSGTLAGDGNSRLATVVVR
jgi:hypothetical protein